MQEFEYELKTDNSINLRYYYGDEWFTFTLYRSEQHWILHPFEGMLIRNADICRLVMTELFQNKRFQVMLARENIILASIRSSVDLEPEDGYMGVDDRSGGQEHDGDELDQWIQYHTWDEMVQFEKDLIEERLTVYKEILRRMFMQDMSPADEEFRNVQQMIRTYEEAHQQLSSPGDSFFDFNKRRF
ncbi:hypothetical protein [Paenibacillus sp. SYP-B4298]|uniref:hypothetical protein n=1 Tax=Paenibacillus sp. SYP-B4298 TaxID=2996034 RepID=UPI0022DCFC51|nr:hypothetical protein [Paenibacillus sp. SYP-B4298]